jgi:hypothetical protein
LGVDRVTVASGAELDLSAQATADSSATTASVPHIVSSLVQANRVKGADQLSATVGTDFTADFGADHNAIASAVTVDNRSDAVLAAYGLGIDRSSAIVGDAAEVAITSEVVAATTAESAARVGRQPQPVRRRATHRSAPPAPCCAADCCNRQPTRQLPSMADSEATSWRYLHAPVSGLKQDA